MTSYLLKWRPELLWFSRDVARVTQMQHSTACELILRDTDSCLWSSPPFPNLLLFTFNLSIIDLFHWFYIAGDGQPSLENTLWNICVEESGFTLTVRTKCNYKDSKTRNHLEHGEQNMQKETGLRNLLNDVLIEKWTWLSIVVIKKVKNMLQMSHHSKLTCLCISHWIRLTKHHVSECLYAIISHIYTSGLVIRAGLDRGFAQRGHSYLLTNHAELSKSHHICSPFTPAICPSHTLQLCCVCGVLAWESVKGGWQSGRKETRERQKSERGEKSNYAYVIERRCRSVSYSD